MGDELRCDDCGRRLEHCKCKKESKKNSGPVYCDVRNSMDRPCTNLFDIGYEHQDRRRENRCHPCNNRIMASDPYELEKSEKVISNFPGGAYEYFRADSRGDN